MTRTARPIPGQVEDRERPAAGDLEQRNAPSGAPTMDGPRLRGLIPYGVPSSDLGGWTEVIEPGALRDARLDGLVATVDHGGVPIARHPGTLTVEDRDDAFHWSLELPESRSDVREAVERRDLCAGSWRMVVARDEWRGSTRHVHEIAELRDVSVVSTPAYAASVVEHRSAPTPAGPTPGPAPYRGGLRVEERQVAQMTPRGRVERAIAAVPAGECRDLVRANVDPVEPDDIRAVLLDRLRDTAVLARAGVPIVATERGIATWPRLTGDVGVSFYNELEPITESDPVMDDFAVPVKKLATLTRVSTEALEDSDPSLAQILVDNITVAMALKADRELLVGSDPKGFAGIMNVAGTQSIAVGGALTWDVLLKATAMLLEADVPPPYAVLLGPRPALALDLLKESGTGAYVSAPASVPQILSTSHFAVSGGAAPATSAVVFAPRAQMIVLRRGVTVEVDRSREFEIDGVLFRGRHRLGLGVPYPASIVKLTGVAAPAIA